MAHYFFVDVTYSRYHVRLWSSVEQILSNAESIESVDFTASRITAHKRLHGNMLSELSTVSLGSSKTYSTQSHVGENTRFETKRWWTYDVVLKHYFHSSVYDAQVWGVVSKIVVGFEFTHAELIRKSFTNGYTKTSLDTMKLACPPWIYSAVCICLYWHLSGETHDHAGPRSCSTREEALEYR